MLIYEVNDILAQRLFCICFKAGYELVQDIVEVGVPDFL